jgi:hypothetical protein
MLGREIHLDTVIKILDSINKSFWENLKISSLRMNKILSQITWYHYKLYKRVNTFDPNALQIPITKHNKHEIPNKRKIFHKSKGRFSLRDTPVTYLSNEHVTSWEEVINEFRYNKGLNYYKHIIPYLEGRFDPTPNEILHFIKCNISKDAIILDLTRTSNLLIKHFEKNWTRGESFYSSVIHTENEDIYPATQLIAQEALKYGFDGIVYRSVRTESGARHPDKNLVMFSQSKVTRK